MLRHEHVCLIVRARVRAAYVVRSRDHPTTTTTTMLMLIVVSVFRVKVQRKKRGVTRVILLVLCCS